MGVVPPSPKVVMVLRSNFCSDCGKRLCASYGPSSVKLGKVTCLSCLTGVKEEPAPVEKPVKVVRNYREGDRSCFTQKIKYTEQDARDAAKYFNHLPESERVGKRARKGRKKDVRLRPYTCPWCRGWHLTSMTEQEQHEVDKRQRMVS